jgi:hypothetical protein
VLAVTLRSDHVQMKNSRVGSKIFEPKLEASRGRLRTHSPKGGQQVAAKCMIQKGNLSGLASSWLSFGAPPVVAQLATFASSSMTFSLGLPSSLTKP